MELPYAKHREKYIELIKELEEELKSITGNSEISDLSLHDIQQKLDTVADKYQNDEKIGTARYKLYELQAFIHYFEHQDDKALDFIYQAIDLRGNTYPKAEKLKNALTPTSNVEASDQTDVSKMTKSEKRQKLVGLEGWLALYVVGLFLSLLVTVFRFFADGFLSSSDIDAINQYQSGLGDTIQNLTAFESLMVVVYVALIVTTLVMLFRKRKLAKSLAIATLIFAAVYGLIDYAIASSITASSGLSQNVDVQTFMSKYSGDVGRSIIAALIWVPYFMVSKRVKATLTK